LILLGILEKWPGESPGPSVRIRWFDECLDEKDAKFSVTMPSGAALAKIVAGKPGSAKN